MSIHDFKVLDSILFYLKHL